jgi:hypothetical protein
MKKRIVIVKKLFIIFIKKKYPVYHFLNFKRIIAKTKCFNYGKESKKGFES